MNVTKSLLQLSHGDVLANHKVVESVHVGYTIDVAFTDGEVRHYNENIVLPLLAKTNCLYGGNVSGHSINCTAKGCW